MDNGDFEDRKVGGHVALAVAYDPTTSLRGTTKKLVSPTKARPRACKGDTVLILRCCAF
jgi:hypothetical protein